MEQMNVIWNSEPDAQLLITVPDGPSWVAISSERLWVLVDMPWGYGS